MASDDKEPRLVEHLLLSRRQAWELISVAVVVAAGVNLLSGAITTGFATSPMLTGLVGVACLLGGFGYAVGRLRALRRRVVTIEGFFLYDENTNDLVRVERYELAEHMESYLASAFVEESALKALWERDRLVNHDHKSQRRSTDAAKTMVLELLEYLVLEKFSLHLGEPGFDEDNQTVVARDDLPDVLIKNRFLDLFSRPLSLRPSLEGNEPPTEGEIIAVFGPSGMYQRFQLVVPKGTKIKRLAPGHVQFRTPRFDLEVSIRFDGFSTNLPRGFEEHYLRRPFGDLRTYAIAIDVNVAFRLRAFLSASNWQYFAWMDSLLSELFDSFDAETFFRRINWETAMTVLLCLPSTTDKRSALTQGPAGEINS